MTAKAVVLNGAKMNFDGKLDFSGLAPEVVVYDDTRPDQILERIADCTIVVTKEMPVEAGILAQFPDSVRLLCEAGTGYNNIDLGAARKKDIIVCNIPAYSTQRVAHTAILLLLSLASSMREQIGHLACGDYSNFTRYLSCGHVEVNGKTLGVIGAGAIGRNVIRIAQALDMNVLVHTRTPKEDSLRYVGLEELLTQSDFVTLHCPLTDKTRHMIDAKALSCMKPSAFLVNTSRGALVDEAALISALQKGEIAGAGLDVQEMEPPAEDNPLYTMENVLLTPHMGWKGLETRQRLVSLLAENIRNFLQGHPINVVS